MTLPTEPQMHDILITTQRPTIEEACQDLHAYVVTSGPPLDRGVRLLACLDVLSEAAHGARVDGEPPDSP